MRPPVQIPAPQWVPPAAGKGVFAANGLGCITRSPGRRYPPKWPAPTPRPGALKWVGWGFVLWAVGFCPPLLLAQSPPFTLEAEWKTGGKIHGVAVNADESLLAAAQGRDPVQVVLYDRRSHAPLGLIEARVGGPARLIFAPAQDLLVVSGPQGVELWDASISRLKAGKPLPAASRLWRQELDHPAGDVALDDSFKKVVWSQPGGLWQREARTGAPPPDKPFWTVKGELRIRGVALAGTNLAVAYEGEKSIDLVSPGFLGKAKTQATLEGHRFAVAAMASRGGGLGGGGLVSLDSGRYLISWGTDRQPESITFLDFLPADVQPEGMAPLGGSHWMLVSRQTAGKPGGGEKILVLDKGKPTGEMDSPPFYLLAASPTGKYLLAARHKRLQLYVFAQPASPLAYVRQLKAAGGTKTALSYYQQLDTTGLSPALVDKLKAELNTSPGTAAEDDFLARLKEAQAKGDLTATEHWATQALLQDPENPQAKKALAGLKGMEGSMVVEQARLAYEEGRYRAVITLLTTALTPREQMEEEAAELIRQAEAKRNMETTLDQAEEKMDLGLYTAARTLVDDVLHKDQKNPRANSLKTKIETAEGGVFREMSAVFIGFLLALAIVAGILYKMRNSWNTLSMELPPRPSMIPPFFRLWGKPGAALKSPPGKKNPWETKPGPSNKKGAKPSGGQNPPKGAQPQTAAPPPWGFDRPPSAKRKETEALLHKTEDMVRLARQQDVYRQHTAPLLELEAEINNYLRRIQDPSADVDTIHQRLNHMLDQLRGMNFERKKGGPAPQDEPSFYDVLQVTPQAGQDEIKSAFFRLLKEYHPDKHTQSQFGWIREEAEKMTKRLGEAYHVLKDPKSREAYDLELKKRRSGGK